MPDRIKVLPYTDDAVGMVHPVDGPLEKEGSLWTYDDFTQRRLFDGSIARFEMQAEAKAPDPAAKPARAAKAEPAAVATPGAPDSTTPAA